MSANPGAAPCGPRRDADRNQLLIDGGNDRAIAPMVASSELGAHQTRRLRGSGGRGCSDPCRQTRISPGQGPSGCGRSVILRSAWSCPHELDRDAGRTDDRSDQGPVLTRSVTMISGSRRQIRKVIRPVRISIVERSRRRTVVERHGAPGQVGQAGGAPHITTSRSRATAADWSLWSTTAARRPPTTLKAGSARRLQRRRTAKTRGSVGSRNRSRPRNPPDWPTPPSNPRASRASSKSLLALATGADPSDEAVDGRGSVRRPGRLRLARALDVRVRSTGR